MVKDMLEAWPRSLPPLPAAFVSAHSVLISLQEGMSFSCSYVSHIPHLIKESNFIHGQGTWTYQAQLRPAYVLFHQGSQCKGKPGQGWNLCSVLCSSRMNVIAASKEQ